MKVNNRLKEILEELGIRTMVPTSQTLENKLGGMTLIRFNKLFNNVGNDIRLYEAQMLTSWLVELTGRPADQLQVVATMAATKEVVGC